MPVIVVSILAIERSRIWLQLFLQRLWFEKVLNAIFERKSEWIGVRMWMSVGHDYKIVVDAGSRIVVYKSGCLTWADPSMQSGVASPALRL